MKHQNSHVTKSSYMLIHIKIYISNSFETIMIMYEKRSELDESDIGNESEGNDLMNRREDGRGASWNGL